MSIKILGHPGDPGVLHVYTGNWTCLCVTSHPSGFFSCISLVVSSGYYSRQSRSGLIDTVEPINIYQWQGYVSQAYCWALFLYMYCELCVLLSPVKKYPSITETQPQQNKTTKQQTLIQAPEPHQIDKHHISECKSALFILSIHWCSFPLCFIFVAFAFVFSFNTQLFNIVVFFFLWSKLWISDI